MGLFLRSPWDFKPGHLFLSFICALVLFSSNIFAEELIKIDGALKKMFTRVSHLDRQVVSLSAEQIRRVEEAARLTFAGKHSSQVIVHIAREQNTVVGYAFEDTAIGKWGPIHYLIGLDTNGAVSQIIILDHQEIRGRPISKPRFLRQYRGKTLTDPLQLHKDIDGITGATISSNSLTEGVRKILHIYKLVKSQLS
ncbi:MAG: hypothetical protein A3G91_05750 [Omnitrophica WOR_2 bacterium RIFCSPLOWO2_12_FULL_50_9]|nr:MAG: hypothetical protein A3G91_05750 [Omnitrophica WOR_2 bacterium RIFCSPLOWO2_12_FULL_50_9]